MIMHCADVYKWGETLQCLWVIWSCLVDRYSICNFFFFKQKTAYEIYQCDWSSDVCSSDLVCRVDAAITLSDFRDATGHESAAGWTVREVADSRSEERRVGKECRSRWSPYH